jgi:uncharacterized SAM-dependent methyltransferase
MQYYTVKQIAETYNVSVKTPYLWIERAKKGGNKLKLANIGNMSYVIMDEANRSELMRLSSEGRKHHHKSDYEQRKVNQEFYKVFSESEQLQIYSDLVDSGYFNLKYWYYNGGAKLWDEFYTKGQTPIRNIVQELLGTTVSEVQYMTKQFSAVNVVDLGCGNSLPALKFIGDLGKKVYSYRGVDISSSMLLIAESNIKQNLPQIPSSFSICDIEENNLRGSLLKNRYIRPDIANIVLYLGNTVNNHLDRQAVLHNLRISMFQGDLLIITVSLKTLAKIAETDYAQSTNKAEFEWVPQLLGFEVNDFEYRSYWDEEKQQKVTSLVLNQNYEIEFNIGGERKTERFVKGQQLIVWNHQLPARNEFLIELEKANFKIRSFKNDQAENNAIIICEPK